MWDIVFYLLLIIILAGLGFVGAMLVRNYLNGESPTAGLFGAKADRRLDVVDQAAVDGRRRLILIRRDNVEHLLMTGGPVDVVIETNIKTNTISRAPNAAATFKSGNSSSGNSFKETSQPSAETEDDGPVFSRKPRTLGHEKADT